MGLGRTVFALGAFIFLLAFKPSDPHLTAYLRSIGFSSADVNARIYPVWTYSYLALLGFGAYAAEAMSYKHVIAFGALARVVTRFLIIYGRSLPVMQLMQVTYAMGSVAETVFYSYVFRVVGPADFQRVTSWVQAAYLLGHVASNLLGDFLMDVFGVTLATLNFVSAATVGAAAIVAVVCFPSESNARVAHVRTDMGMPEPLLAAISHELIAVDVEQTEESDPAHGSVAPVGPTDKMARTRGEPVPGTGRASAIASLLAAVDRARTTAKAPVRVLLAALGRPGFALLSAWYCVGLACYGLVWGYESSLYDELLPASQGTKQYNGSVLAAALLLGAGMALLPAHPRLTRALHGSRRSLLVTLATTSLAVALALLASWLLQQSPAASLSSFVVYYALWQMIQATFSVHAAAVLRSASPASPDAAEVPYSACFSLIAFSALLVQSALQAVLFSWLQMSIASAMGVMAVLLLVATLLVPIAACTRA